jgi:proton-dependent oligopeptide transporter, POT family
VIAFVEFAERFSYYGATIVFTNFIQKELPTPTGKAPGNGQPGALGMGQQVATGITTFNSFWYAYTPSRFFFF